MNCHGNYSKGKERTHNHGPLKHILHMVLCCGLPIVILLFLPIIARFSPSASGVIGRIVPFICPIMMILMIPMVMSNNKKSSCCVDKSIDGTVKPNKNIE
ncbi:MAG: hypothetical protein Q8936_12750 [Bacillota bacterium]|nr:hypothetical protein [Bacillota bacterium]